MSDSTSSKVAIFVAGLGIGAVAALLLAPQSGEETREFIGKKAQQGRSYLEAKGRELQKQTRASIEKGSQTARDWAAASKQFVSSVSGN